METKRLGLSAAGAVTGTTHCWGSGEHRPAVRAETGQVHRGRWTHGKGRADRGV